MQKEGRKKQARSRTVKLVILLNRVKIQRLIIGELDTSGLIFQGLTDVLS